MWMLWTSQNLPLCLSTFEEYQRLLLHRAYIMLYHPWTSHISNIHLQNTVICWSCCCYWKKLEKTKWNENTVRLAYPWPAEQTQSYSDSFSDWQPFEREFPFYHRWRERLLFEVDLISIIPIVLFIFLINKEQATENPGTPRRDR